MNSGLSNFFKQLHSSMKKHSPEILTGLGICGMITSTVTAVRATPKALILLDKKKKEEKKEKLKKSEVIKTTWKCYIPSVITGVISIGCLIGASTVNYKRNAALATAYSLSESALKLYQEKVIETIGEKEEQKVKDAVAKERIDRTPVVSKEVIITEKGNTLCFDTISSRYFKSDVETLRRAENEINRRLYNELYITLNEFYYEIGLTSTKIGDELGWSINSSGPIKLSFSSQLAADDTPCLVVDYETLPKYDFTK